MAVRSASTELIRAYPSPSTPGSPNPAERIVRASLTSRAIGRRVAELAKAQTPVLLLGETGTGKTLIARELHALRQEGALWTLNCACLRDSELAEVVCQQLRPELTKNCTTQLDTLVIDEIGELPPWGQAVLLRALAACGPACGPRVVAATHRDLEAMVRAGTFSGELLMRLRGATIQLPALRERKDEIAALALHFLRVALCSSQLPFVLIDPLVPLQLELHSWPGNVRELTNVMVSSLARARDGVVDLDALPEEITDGRPYYRRE